MRTTVREKAGERSDGVATSSRPTIERPSGGYLESDTVHRLGGSARSARPARPARPHRRQRETEPDAHGVREGVQRVPAAMREHEVLDHLAEHGVTEEHGRHDPS
jgi:hypothetical protein